MKSAILTIVLSVTLACTTGAKADTPAVLADLAPTHSLVTLVMGDLGTPQLLMPAGSSPHDYSLTPSDAALLDNADIVFHASASLTPWLTRAIRTLADTAVAIELINSPGTLTLPFRDNNLFQPHEHDHDHESAEHDEDDHDSDLDPHAWLDPINAQLWLDRIATELSRLDPENQATYISNAQQARVKIDDLIQVITQQLDFDDTAAFIVFHDSYHYFESRFDIHAKAAISLGDAQKPGIRQINQLRKTLQQYPGACVFSEPQFSNRLIDTITDGLDIHTGELDPLGATLEPGADLYEKLLQNLSNTVAGCLGMKK